VTRASRPASGRSPLPGQDSPSSRLVGGWHAACFLFPLSGCFYLGPIPTLEENMPPYVESSSFENGDPIEIGPLGQRVFVIVSDDDGDEVQFDWSLSRDGYIGDAVPIAEGYGSQIDLEYDPELDQQRLSCLIRDGVSESVLLTWDLEVL
jgi:hypothetical protein